VKREKRGGEPDEGGKLKNKALGGGNQNLLMKDLSADSEEVGLLKV